MTTLHDASLAVARKLAVLIRGTVDSGSATTCVDALRREVDDHFIGGTIWAINTTDDAAPAGEWAIVTDFEKSSGTITHESLTAVFGAGDTYGIATNRFPLSTIITAINDQLINYKAPRYDATSLDVVVNQSEYTLPAGITKYNLLNVYESTVDDSDNNRWSVLKFRVQPAAAGSQHTLVIESRRIGVGNDFLLEYESWVEPVSLATDVIDESIPLPRLAIHAAANVVLMTMSQFASGNDLDMELWKFLTKQAAEYDRKWPTRPTKKRGKVMESGGTPFPEKEGLVAAPAAP